MTVPDLRWYAVQVRSRHEKLVSGILFHKGYTEFLPVYRARRRSCKGISEIDSPLFPGYVFCHFDIHDRRTPVLTTPGVIRLVGWAGVPATIDESEIVSIKRVLSSGIAAEPCPYIAAGDAVQIESGPLAGVKGIYIRENKHQKLVVSMTLLQRSVMVEIDKVDVTSANSRTQAAA
jgi:transcription antitermination factor NusG